MRQATRILSLLSLSFALMLPACAQELDISTLTPVECEAVSEELEPTALYCGPTQGFLREEDATFDANDPFVYFGQYDCWAMVAAGTLEEMGAIGWIENAYTALPETPELAFDDALSAMIEEDTFLTVTPFAEEPQSLGTIVRGTQVTLLAQMGDWAYVQTEMDEMPVRAFVPVSSVL